MGIKKKLGILLTSLAMTLSFQKPLGNLIMEYISSFPSEIPGAAKIEKYPIAGSENLLIHVRQMHIGDNISEFGLKKIEETQRDIYNILGFLIKNKKIKNIRLEAIIYDEEKKDYSEKIKIHYNHFKKKVNNEYIAGGARKLIIEKKIKGKPAEIKETYETALNTVNNKYQKEKARLFLEEYQKLNKKDKISLNEYLNFMYKGEHTNTWKIMEKVKKDPLVIKKALDDREDALLSIIAKDRENLSITSYGANHAWGGEKSCGKNYGIKNTILSNKDNIYEWNKKYPNNKFSLIEITPKRLPEKISKKYFK